MPNERTAKLRERTRKGGPAAWLPCALMAASATPRDRRRLVAVQVGSCVVSAHKPPLCVVT